MTAQLKSFEETKMLVQANFEDGIASHFANYMKNLLRSDNLTQEQKIDLVSFFVETYTNKIEKSISDFKGYNPAYFVTINNSLCETLFVEHLPLHLFQRFKNCSLLVNQTLIEMSTKIKDCDRIESWTAINNSLTETVEKISAIRETIPQEKPKKTRKPDISKVKIKEPKQKIRFNKVAAHDTEQKPADTSEPSPAPTSPPVPTA